MSKVNVVCLLIFAIILYGACGEFGKIPGDQDSLGAELIALEKVFINNNKKLLASALELKERIVKLRPRQKVRASNLALKELNRSLAELYRKSPKYKEQKYQKPVASELAKVAGLPEAKLAVYQTARGTYGLKKVLLTGEHIEHHFWVLIYFQLIHGNADKIECSGMSEVAAPERLRMAGVKFCESRKKFKKSQTELTAKFQKRLADEKDNYRECRLRIKIAIWEKIARQAGRADKFGIRAAHYPDMGDVPGQDNGTLSQIAKLLRIPRSDLVYMYKRSGAHGVRNALSGCHDLKNLNEVLKSLAGDKLWRSNRRYVAELL